MKCPNCQFTVYFTEKPISAHRTRFYDDDPVNLFPPFCPVCGHSFAQKSEAESQKEPFMLSASECLDVPITGEILPQYWWVTHMMVYGEEILKNWDDSYVEYAQDKYSMLVQIANEIYTIANKYTALDEPFDDEKCTSFFSEEVSQQVKSDIESAPLIVSSGAFSNVAPKDPERETELKSHPRYYVMFYLMEALDILIHEVGIQTSAALEWGNVEATLEAVSRMSEYWTAYYGMFRFFTEMEENLDLDPDAYQYNLWLLFNHLAMRMAYMNDLEALTPTGDASFDKQVEALRGILNCDIVIVFDELLVDGTLEENLLAAEWYRQWGNAKYFSKEEYLMMINAYVSDGDDWDYLEKLEEYVKDMP